MGPPVRIERTTYCLRNSRSGRLSYEGKVVLPAGLEPAHGANLARTGYKAGGATLHYRRKDGADSRGRTYMLARRVLSALCLPFHHIGKVVGIEGLEPPRP